jgi:translation initiation factor 6
MERTISFGGDPNIGVFSRIFEDIAVIPPSSTPEFGERLKELLGVEILVTAIQGSHIIGSLLAGNSHALVVSGLASDEEVARLKEYREVMLLSDTMNAAGNVILANDNFAAVHPEMPSYIRDEIKSYLRVDVHSLTFAGIKTVGMAGVATNRGILVHPRSTRTELARLEEISGLPVGVGSINLGSGLVGAGLVANSRGYAAGVQTSGFELGRVEDVFGFLERS